MMYYTPLRVHKEAAASARGSQQLQPPAVRQDAMVDLTTGGRARPNRTFLTRFLGGMISRNQRAIADNASHAARKVGALTNRAANALNMHVRQLSCLSEHSCSQAAGAAVAASLRPALQRAGKKGLPAVRRVCLSHAQRHKLSLCTALLSEVRYMS